MIFFVRHGEAAAKWGDHPDPGLSETGRAQAEAVAAFLASQKIDAVLTSPMQRCQETAAPFCQLSGLSAQIDGAFTEIPTPGDITDRVPWLQALMSGDWSGTPESIKVWHRALIEGASKLSENTVVFSHFIAINALVGHCEGNPAVTVFRPDYCSVTRLQADAGALQLVERGQEQITKVL